MDSHMYEVIRQGFPVIIGALTGVSFGTMLGWPSVVYPLLVNQDNSPIFLTWDQTALIAGILMQGNIIGTAFSKINIFGSKVSVLLGFCCEIIGWIILYFSQESVGLGFARGMVGFGNGFALRHTQMYINETCNPKLKIIFLQYMPLAVNVGVVIVHVLGLFTTFNSLSIACFFIPTVALAVFAVVPKKEYLPVNEDRIVTITNSIEANKDAQTKDNQQSFSEELGWLACLKDKKIRKRVFLLWCIIFVPQYTGGASSIVYAQVIFLAALNPYPQVCAILYSIVFLLSTFLSIKYTNKFPIKHVIIASCIICSILLCSVCFYFYFMLDLLNVSSHFAWSPLVLLLLYNFFHVVGINIIPVILVNNIFPKNARAVASQFYIMYFSLSAVLSTKVFQAFFTEFGMHIAYGFCSCVAVASAILIGCFVKEPSNKTFKIKLAPVTQNLHIEKKYKNKVNQSECNEKYTSYYYCNEVDLKDEVVLADDCQLVCRNIRQNVNENMQPVVENKM